MAHRDLIKVATLTPLMTAVVLGCVSGEISNQRDDGRGGASGNAAVGGTSGGAAAGGIVGRTAGVTSGGAAAGGTAEKTGEMTSGTSSGAAAGATGNSAVAWGTAGGSSSNSSTAGGFSVGVGGAAIGGTTSATGGSVTVGGNQASGGTNSGGAVASGGTTIAGVASVGGVSASGGAANTGGAPVSGGTLGSAGTSFTGGGATGGVGSGGAAASGGYPTGCNTTGGVGSTGGIAGIGGTGGCNPSRSFCKGNDIHICSADGLSSTKAAGCLAITQYCEPTTVTCVPTVCTTFGQPSCDGNVATYCNCNGSGFDGARVDCGTTGQVCSHGACYSRMVDTVGADPALSIANQVGYSYGSVEITNFYEVRSTRYLLTAEIYASYAKDIVLTCSVYESDVKSGTYYLKSPGSGGISSSPTSAVTAGWHACNFTPPVELAAGRFYAIGVGSPPYFGYYVSQQPATYTNTFATAFLFSTYQRGQSIYTSSTTSQIADQRLTTVP